jgi:GNAT superfamily N-acetyltransferase
MKIEADRLEYRRANASDVEVLVDYRIRFLNELYHHPEDGETQVLREALQEYFSKAIPSNSFIAWLAEHDGKVVGTGGMVVWQIPGRYEGLESGRAGYILNMYTIPEARRNGICTRLLEELTKEAKSLGISYLHLHASKDGEGIYRKAGFADFDQPEMKLRLK